MNPVVTDPDELLGEDRVAKWIDHSEKTLQAWRVRGGGPPFLKISRLVKYRRGDVQAWLESRRVQSTSQVMR